ncbi:hypothetical protein BU24DRAFT_459042 [Aaosphaeria arxii CBS 175.79]|uniref:Nudix hydrolase domain-containing protein n=1 Tax=Aaosphaeria arxii CBS 175.79 TaxID=1450172 RepID=A0A6A5Y3H4_9PLEO|nr:uncharacterized protein BU24DRAFT_459042 [Aaosphaeria arxii CBS 175.79]KAF2019360.1 hypothetical protein BU24DRAFT_459042 [Aaosphaeria arxii CBS 175.79]
MTAKVPFEYPQSLEEYMVTEKEFLARNPQYTILCSGGAVFNDKDQLLLVQRAKEELAFANFWEIPGGKVDDTDETILHAVAREVKEETGLDVTRFVRKIGEFGWEEFSKRTQETAVWQKLIFEVEVKTFEIQLDPLEHQDYLFATEEEVAQDMAGQVTLRWITPINKELNLEAFKLRRQGNTTRAEAA